MESLAAMYRRNFAMAKQSHMAHKKRTWSGCVETDLADSFLKYVPETKQVVFESCRADFEFMNICNCGQQQIRLSKPNWFRNPRLWQNSGVTQWHLHPYDQSWRVLQQPMKHHITQDHEITSLPHNAQEELALDQTCSLESLSPSAWHTFQRSVAHTCDYLELSVACGSYPMDVLESNLWTMDMI